MSEYQRCTPECRNSLSWLAECICGAVDGTDYKQRAEQAEARVRELEDKAVGAENKLSIQGSDFILKHRIKNKYIEKLQAQVERLSYYLKIYIHAEKNGQSVRSIIESEAEQALTETDTPQVCTVEGHRDAVAMAKLMKEGGTLTYNLKLIEALTKEGSDGG